MRRFGLLVFMAFFAVVAWGQGVPHLLTGTVQLQEGMYPEDACLYLNITVGTDEYTIVPADDAYDETTGQWWLILDGPAAGTGVTVSAVDSCWYEDGTIYGMISDSLSTDIGLLTLTEIEGLRPILYDVSVAPTSGYVEDDFYFQVSYESDPWNRPPAVFELYIDGALAANASAVDPGDTEYRDGAQFFAQLTGATITRGEHTFYFYAEDVLNLPAWSDTLEFTVLNHPPVLSSASLSAVPDPAVETSTITCTPGTATDSESDPITFEYNWYVNGSSVGVSADNIDGTYFNKGDEVWCEVTPYDGFDYGDVVESDHIVIQNTAPEAPEIAIDPANPFDFENITALISTPSYDADGDDITYSYEWLRDDILYSESEILGNSLTTTGETWTLRVTPNDGETDGDPAELEFTIGGPVLSDGRVEPTSGHPATTEFTYYVTYTNSRNYPPGYVLVDIDGTEYSMAPVNPIDENYIDGAIYYYTKTLEWGEHQFRFVAMDDHGDVAIGMSDYIAGPEMTNTPPVIDAVSIMPSETATELDVIMVSVDSWHDDDGDDVTFTYKWYRNGLAIDGATTSMLTGDDFDKGDTIYCEVTPHDDYSDGDVVNTDEVIIVNAPPSVDGVDIIVEPEGEATELSTLTASVVGANDPDGDDLVITYEWYVNGSPLGLDPSTNSIDGDYFDRGNDVFVQATVSDGEYDAVATSATITIGNTLPIVTEFGIFPEEPYTDDDLLVAIDYEDPDDDSVVVQYIWWRNYEFFGNDASISAEYTSHFDTWVVEVRLEDGFVEGEYVSVFDTVTILNSLPVVDDFTDTVTVGGAHYNAYISANDIDGDALSYTVVDGPSDIRILSDGLIDWDVPDVDVLTSYDVTIAVGDGFDETELSFTLWAYPITHPIFAPTELEATGGYVGMIPLTWEQPSAFTTLDYLPVTFVGYEVWRSTTPDTEFGDWVSYESFVPNYVDLYVDAYQIYYYYIVALYDVGGETRRSAPSNMDNAFSIEGELTNWYSRFSFAAPPTIDGVIDYAEWSDAMTYELGEASLFKLYFKHSNDYLYIALENIADTELSPDDMFMVSIDDNYNHRWPSDGPSTEGEYRIKAAEGGDEVTFQGIWGLFPDDIIRDVRGAAEGLLGASSDDEGYVCYELAIPIGDLVSDLNIDELGNWIGLRIAVYNVDDYEWQLVQPAGSDAEDPENFGSLFLEVGANPGTICIDPAELTMTLREGEIRSTTLNICNCGDGYLSYTLSEACSPNPFGGGLLRTATTDIVAYIDDESLIPQALAVLGYSADTYTDPTEFLLAVSAGGWNLVIVSAIDVSAPEIWNAVQAAHDAGVAILIQTPDLDSADEEALTSLGLALGEDLEDRGCALTWDIPDHPFFNIPMAVPASVEQIEGEFDDYGDNIIPGAYSVLASFDLYPYPINAAILYDAEQDVIVNSFIFSSLNDTDEDGVIDGVELLVNEIWGLKPCEDVAWLDENPTSGTLAMGYCDEIAVVFDATDLSAGEYYAYIAVNSNDPTAPMVMVPCHLTVLEPEERLLELSFPDETVFGCQGDEIIVSLYIGSLEEMYLTDLELTVSVDPDVAQPTDVDVLMGDFESMSAGPGTLTFSLSSDVPLMGDGVLAMVHFTVNDVSVGTITTLGISGVSYNPDAYVTDVYTYPGQLMVSSCENDWRMTLEFQVSGERADDVVIGVNPDGTDAFDEGLDEENVPPEGWFDVWSDISAWDSEHPALSTDIRDAFANEIHWFIETGDSAGKVEWTFDDGVDITGLGSIFLYCGDDVVDMKTASVYFYDAGQDIEVVYRLTGEQPFVFHFEPGYSMFSLPLNLDDYLVNDIFPGNLGCWSFDTDLQTWSPASALAPGVGYVILFAEATDVTLWGTPVENLDLNLAPGWNLIGTVSEEIDFSVPDVEPEGSLLGSPEYAWYYDSESASYVLTSTLLPGEGYFVAALNSCVLHLPGGGAGKAVPKDKPIWTGKLFVGDEQLQIGVGERQFLPIPPAVPSGDGKKAYIVEDGWKLISDINPDACWTVVLEEDALVSFDLPDDVVLTLADEPLTEPLMLSAGTYKLATSTLPTKFALKQNTPNPFNASTMIEFDLPEETDVSIAIYDVSGHLVRTLMSGKLSAGYHKLIWRGDDDSGNTINSGIYFYRMKAGSFSAVRRMVIVK